MKRRKYYLLLIIVIFIIGEYGMYNYYASPKQRLPYPISQEQDNTLHIAYIGDSWAFIHRVHDCQIPKILEDTLHRPVAVHSYGICGITSKDFYENLFKNKDLKFFIQRRRYAYCFISLGINDTYKKMKTTYYQKSLDYIVNFFLSNHVHPIILEIPDYDIEKAYRNQTMSRKILRRLSIIITGTKINCKQDFREVLNKLMLENNNYNHRVDIIRYKEWNSHNHKDHKDYYLHDHMHLNNKGYALLDSCIAKHIWELEKTAKWSVLRKQKEAHPVK